MREPAIVLYDGACPTCRGWARRLRALDWRSRLRLADARDPAVLAAFPDVDAARARRRLQLVVTEGQPPLEGFHAFRWIAGRLPPLWVLWPLLWLPGMARLGVKVYDAVAAHRPVEG